MKVVDAYTVVLDENSTEAPKEAEGVNAIVKRTINANEWSTIVLPFAMSEEQVKEAFGEDVKVKDFTGIDFDEENDHITVNFVPVNQIEANHPYIIKVSEKISEFSVNGVNIIPKEEPVVVFGTGGKGRHTRGYQACDFVGTYVSNYNILDGTSSTVNYPLFLSENKFWYADEEPGYLKAFRAFFDFYVFDNPSAGVRISMSSDDLTGINNVTIQSDGKYYNLNGLRVETPSKGVYIKDGKKVVVK